VIHMVRRPQGVNTVIAAASAGTAVGFAPMFTRGLNYEARPWSIHLGRLVNSVEE